MKTTLEIPTALFRKAKATAAERGQTLKDFITEAVREKLTSGASGPPGDTPPWMSGFGTLKRLHRETMRVQARVEEEFEAVEPEDRL